VSHHGESPLARKYPLLDVCDLYVFRGSDGTVLIMTLSPLSGPRGFHSDGRYDFHLDLDGDSIADVTLRTAFGADAARGRQDLQLRLLTGDGTAPGDPGEILASGQTEIVTGGSRGIRVWAGRAGDPFYINGTVVGAVTQAVQAGAPLDLQAVAAERTPANLFGGTNVNAIVIEFPDDALPRLRPRHGWPRRRQERPEAGHDGRIGFWATTAVRRDGAWHRVQRIGQPLIPTIYFPPDSSTSSAYQTTDPAQDAERYGSLVCDLTAQLAARLGVSSDPRAHGQRIRDLIFPDVLWYRPGTPAAFTFAERNGRGLTDPVAEVMFALVTGRAVPLGVGTESVTGPLRDSFPYLATPVAEPAVRET
jgi:uncharacterized protein DUF4331